ncbi:hypothetical protein [Paraclostridium sordellii]|uniref:hypothetical protein n=1 Tax=Paraclostridium sordellii TaxID=1505 RepID=UPI000385E257|nr:hypothetical protein [Paeniclostridium sordellii]EPZ61697.1 hypothetical protein H476_3600 [[Clostridium] sordellii VPI 9048] [Paeniclostridium sordellii VPI 9048]
MAKTKEEIKQEFEDARATFEDTRAKFKDSIKDKEREEYAKTKKVNYWSTTCWETMSQKKLKRINTLLKCFGIFALAFGLLFLFGVGDKTSILLIVIGLYLLYFDPRRYSNSSKKNKKH